MLDFEGTYGYVNTNRNVINTTQPKFYII